MHVVVDTNVVIAALLKPGGWTASQLHRDHLSLVAPALLDEELHRYQEELAQKAGCSQDAMRRRIRRLLERIALLPEGDLVAHDEHETVETARSVDSDDATFLAAVVHSEANHLWTYDQALLDALPGVAVTAPPDPHDA